MNLILHPNEDHPGLSQIFRSYYIVLNSKHEVLLYYNSEQLTWALPQSAQLILSGSSDCLILALDSEGSSYNLVQGFHLPKGDRLSYCRWSQLTQLKLYDQLRDLWDEIYRPWKLNIVLDLDDTLWSCGKLDTVKLGHDSVCHGDIVMQSSYLPDTIAVMNQHTRYVWTRPHLKACLQTLSRLGHISYWTCGSQYSHEVVLKQLGMWFPHEHHFYRQDCTEDSAGFPYKSFMDLNRQKPEIYDLDRTILIDDSNYNHFHNYENCYRIPSWSIMGYYPNLDQAMKDTSLLDLMGLMTHFSDQVIHEGRTIRELLQLLHQIRIFPKENFVVKVDPPSYTDYIHQQHLDVV